MVEVFEKCPVCKTKLEHPRRTWMKLQREDGLYYLADPVSLDVDTPIEEIIAKIKGKRFKSGWYCTNGHIPRVTGYDKSVEEAMYKLERDKEKGDIIEDEE